MLFDLRSIYFLSLIVGSLAAPLPSFGSSETDDSSSLAPLEAWNPSQADYEDILQLERRTAGLIPSSVTCGTTRYGSPVVIPRQKILNALLAAEKDATSSRGKTYPAFYGNLNGRLSVLKDADALDGQRRGDLREQPVGTTQTWTGGDLKYVGASMYRVIYDNKIMDPEQSYIGMVYHERDEEGAFLPCIEAVEPACPPTTARRSLWDLVRRAVGKQPTKSPASCKKPAPKKSAPKQAARWTPPSPPSPPSPKDSTLNRPQNASPRPPKTLGPQESSASFSPPAPPSPPSSPTGPSLNVPHSSPSSPNTLTPDMPAQQRPAPIPQIY